MDKNFDAGTPALDKFLNDDHALIASGLPQIAGGSQFNTVVTPKIERNSQVS